MHLKALIGGFIDSAEVHFVRINNFVFFFYVECFFLIDNISVF